MRLVVAAAALIACKASGSAASDGGAALQSTPAAASAVEAPPSSETPPAPPVAAHPTATGSPGATPTPAQPLSSSLSELGRAPLPQIEGEAAIAVFVERVSGGLMPNIDRATSRLRAGMRACYLRSVEDDPPDASRLSLRIVVSTNGSVKSVRSENVSEIGESAVDCMIRRAQNATFPPPVADPAEIVLSIAFLPPSLR